MIGASRESLDALGTVYWRNYNLKIAEGLIGQRLIFNDDLREWSRELTQIDSNNQIRFFEKRLDPLTETMVLPDKVIIIVWSSLPVATVIRDKDAAVSYQQFFEILWEQANE